MCPDGRAMTNQQQYLTPSETFAALANYKSQHLTPEQAAEYLDDLKSLVASIEPASVIDARQEIGALCKFLADTGPASGETLADLFTEARLGTWTNAQKRTGRSVGAIQTAQGRIRRAVRVLNGMPAHCRKAERAKISLQPLSDMEFARLVTSAGERGAPALRGLVAAIGCGVVGAPSIGARISVDGDVGIVTFADGSTRKVLPQVAAVAARLVGESICDGDWEELRSAGVPAVVALNSERARQTHWWLGFSLNAPVAALMRDFKLTFTSIDGILPYLSIEPSLPEETIFEILRGPAVVTANTGTLGAMTTTGESDQS